MMGMGGSTGAEDAGGASGGGDEAEMDALKQQVAAMQEQLSELSKK